MICRWILGDDAPWHIYGPPGIQLMVDRLLEMHRPDLEMRMKIRTVPREMPNIVVHEIDQGLAAEVDGVRVTAFDVDHFPLDRPFGYLFESKDRKIVLSGDTCPCENLIRHAHGADVLIHECVQYEKWRAPQIDKSHTPHAHTSPQRLSLVAKDADVGLLVTTHMMPDSEPRELSRDHPPRLRRRAGNRRGSDDVVRGACQTPGCHPGLVPGSRATGTVVAPASLDPGTSPG